MYYVGFSHHLYIKLLIIKVVTKAYIIHKSVLIIKVVTKAYIIHKVIDYKGGD
jgi:hypothetical protein